MPKPGTRLYIWMGKNRWSSVPSVWSGHALWYVGVRSLVRITVTTLGTPAVCVQACDAKGLQERLHFQRDFVFSRTKAIGEDLSCGVSNCMPQPLRPAFAAHHTLPHTHLGDLHVVDNDLPL